MVRLIALVTTIACLSAAVPANGQDSAKRAISVGIKSGSTGLGLDVAVRALTDLSIRGGFNYFSWNVADKRVEFDGEPLLVSAEIALDNLELIADYSPSRAAWLRLSAGAAVYVQNRVSTSSILADGQSINDVQLTAEETGRVDLSYSTSSPIAPYLGIGFGSSVPRGRVGFNVDLGAFYRGAPQFQVEGTGILRGNARNEPILEANTSHLRIWPLLSFRLAVRVN